MAKEETMGFWEMCSYGDLEAAQADIDNGAGVNDTDDQALHWNVVD